MKQALFALFGLATATAAAGERPWTSDDILAFKVVSDPHVSPDGRFVAYVVTQLNEEGDEYQSDVWLVPAAGGEARALTASPANDDTPRWSPDGREIAFLSERPRPGRKKEDGDDEARRQVWAIRPDGGEARPLTDAPGSVSRFEWTRGGRAIAFLAREAKSEERKRKEKDKDDWWTPAEMFPWSRLWILDLATREARRLTNDKHATGFSSSPDGERLVVALQATPLASDSLDSDLYLVAASGGSPTPLVARLGRDASPSWSPDGTWIAFVTQDGKDRDWYTNTFIGVVSPEGGVPRNLTARFDERIGGLSGPVWTADSRAVLFPAVQRTAQHLFRATLDGVVSALTDGPEVNAEPSIDSRGTTLVFTREAGAAPREVWRRALPAGTAEAVTDTNPGVRERLPFRKELVTWTGADGWEMDGLLVYPAGHSPGKRVPLLLNVHGGPAGTHTNSFTAGSRLYGFPLFAQKGWALFFPNPRGSGGYGERFRAANVRDWGGKDYQDIMAGVDALVARGIADPDSLAVCGWSYGGYMTSTIVTRTDRFKAAVVGAGVTHLASFTGTTDIPDFARSYFGSWPWEDPRVYTERSAVYGIGRVRTPTLVVHGEKDVRVPPEQGWELYTALKKAGVPTDLVVLPRQPHGPREPRLLKACQEWHLDWLERYTLGSGS
ncbi:MAG TPA: S9 family peptidase [Vicinamibacteria bacterium]|nr:S9 family peptidase [Vicinamibacteria bacterium]